MKKFKAILFYAFVTIGLAAAVWAYFYLKQTKKPSLNASEVLPENALSVITTSNFHDLANKLTNQNLIWNGLIGIHEFRKVNNSVQYFDSLISEAEPLKAFFENRQICLGLYSEKGNTVPLITFNLRDLAMEGEFVETVSSALKCEFDKDNQSEFWNSTKRYFVKTSNGVVAVSESKELVTNCFNAQIKKQSTDEKYKSLIKNLDQDDLFNVYINHSLFNQQKNTINTGELILTGKSVCKIDISPDAITANGFNDCDASSVLNKLAGQQGRDCDFLQVLPFNTIEYKAIAISNYEELKKELPIDTLLIKKFWKPINDSALFNVEKQITENIDAKAIEALFKVNTLNQKALIIEIKDSALVKEALRYVSDSCYSVQNDFVFRLQSKNGDLAHQLFNSLFNVNSNFGFVYGNYLYLTEIKEVSDFYLSSLQNNSSLSQNEMFMNYAKENLLENFNYQWYSALNKDLAKIKNVLSFINDTAVKNFNRMSDVSINLTNYKNHLQFRLNLKHQSSNQNKEVPGLWTFESDTSVYTKPYLFVNHKSGENELVFQDEKNNLYLVNATGNALWKKSINEKCISSIYTVDAFKNGKFQLLFNTSNYIHLIDRNGNYVPGFPVKLPAEASSAMTLMDYENTRDYRLLIACSDKRIYNYNINGTKNEKFTPIKTDGPIKLNIKYCKVGASDYLISSDVEGKIYVYSRRGEGRIDLSNKLVTDSKDFYVEAGNTIDKSKLIYFDEKNSLLESISLVDKKEAVKLGAEFDNPKYYFELIDDDKKEDIIIVDKSKVVCYDFTGNELFRFEPNDVALTDVLYYYDADGAYFLLNDANNELLWVDASTKKISKKITGNGSPLVADLFKDGKKYLLVAEGKFMKCVLLK